MEITRKQWYGIGVGLLIVALIICTLWLIFPRSAVAPEPSGEASLEATSTVPSAPAQTTAPKPVPELPSIAKDDTIASWTFTGVYTNNSELSAQADAEITRLKELVGKGTYSDTSLYVGIANQYELLGDGKQEYEYLSRAIGEGGESAGLPWHNLGVLMERLGALQTARVAYQKATLVQPSLNQWHFSYIEFLTTRMAGDVPTIEKAFAFAFKNIGQDPDILSFQTEWKKL